MKYIRLALIRGIIPLAVSICVIFLMIKEGKSAIEIRSTIAVSLIIFFLVSASVIYEIKNWSLKKQSAVHFFIMLLTVLPTLIFSGWFPLNSPLDFARMFAIFLIFGAIFWTFFYLIFKIIDKTNS